MCTTLLSKCGGKQCSSCVRVKAPRAMFVVQGFTLIELMVVLVIVGVLASAVTLNLNSRNVGKSVRQESLRLGLLMQTAADTAIYSRRQLGIRFHPESYEFYVLDDAPKAKATEADSDTEAPATPAAPAKAKAKAVWQPLEDDKLMMREPQVPLEFEVEIEGIDIILETLEQEKESLSGAQPEPIKPHVLILSNGEIMPNYRIVVMDRDDGEFRYQVYSGEEEPIVVEIEE